jgi:multiple sugar transport system permease protein
MDHLQRISISRNARIWASGLFIIGTIYFGFPILWIVLSATKSPEDFTSTPALWFGHSFHLIQNIQTLFQANNHIYLRWLANSILYAGSGALGVVIVSGLGGYALSKLIGRGASTLSAITLGMVMVPANALVIPIFLLFAKIHIVGTIWSVILPTLPSPRGLFLIKYYSDRNINDELIQAARLDQASELQIYRLIALPILKPMLGTVFLIAFIANSNTYFLPQVMLSDVHLYPVTVGLSNSFGGHFEVVGIFIAMLPEILAFFVVQKSWQKGLTDGQYR